MVKRKELYRDWNCLRDQIRRFNTRKYREGEEVYPRWMKRGGIGIDPVSRVVLLLLKEVPGGFKGDETLYWEVGLLYRDEFRLNTMRASTILMYHVDLPNFVRECCDIR